MNTKLYDKALMYDFEALFKKKGYAYFTKGAYNLNIIGIRSNNNNVVTNLYDDILIVIYNTSAGTGKRVCYPITTEPGAYYMTKPINKKGTAILVPNQYRGCWKIANHKGKYEALCQQKAVSVYRDGNCDKKYDLNPKTIERGIYGINIHRSNETWTRNTIDMYSAGCQVFQSPKEFAAFMRLCNEQKVRYGNNFTYTLINEEDLI